MNNTISNTDDIIDSRDVIARIEELQDDKLTLQNAIADAIEKEDSDLAIECARQELANWLDNENGLELAALEKLASEAEGYAPDWTYGEQLIHDDYFEQAMDEMIAECYELPKDLPFWMTVTYDYIALKQDYTSVDFDGQTYWVR